MSNKDTALSASDDAFLIVGYVKDPRGTGGEVRIDVQTDFPDRFEPGKVLYVDGHPLNIERSYPHKNSVILKLSGIDTADAGRRLRGKSLDIPLEEAHILPEGEYYRFQLIGLDVVSITGEAVGKIIDILPTASNDVYILDGPLGQILIPATEDVVKSIDLDAQQMRIEIIDGLLP